MCFGGFRNCAHGAFVILEDHIFYSRNCFLFLLIWHNMSTASFSISVLKILSYFEEDSSGLIVFEQYMLNSCESGCNLHIGHSRLLYELLKLSLKFSMWHLYFRIVLFSSIVSDVSFK